MPHDDSLILTLVAGFVLAFVLGMLALRFKLSPIVGYLLAGVVVGPFTPGWTADTALAAQLAEVGVILLMFGVGLHFSLQDLMRVRKVALPGAVVQIAAATALGWGVGRLIGLGDAEAALMGFSLSVASTVVLLRALEERKAVKGEAGQIAVGWLIVEDLVMVLALVLIPLIASAAGTFDGGQIAMKLGGTILSVTVFVAFMLLVGGRVLPWVLVRIAHTRSRELFTLGVLAISLGIAYLAYAVFGASFALGAFIAGVVLNGTPLGHNAAERALPLRDAFAVLFFVSVGMLFDPWVLLEQPVAVAAVVAIIVAGKSAAALVITSVFKLEKRASLLIAASLAQIGEFSFILAGVGLGLQVLSRETHDLVLAGALISIVLNPFVFRLADKLAPPPPPPPEAPAAA
ncbi:Kef-type K+ transport system, predicted NAD-binding component [Phenylobacterium zucineum HLK1]|uniref:Kef-type K+ transport system, predicted NAD-binding component n=1 Tax=Phenylobacterium zucineum (strain HLK1) TaxID=450851 RepID=B4RH96_PHEZH|nr:cation:proton antiporter [Phenylobacterium zucineum]ACG79044.1 Kef-type K+ transport system, predicted NAD-binding component [Phenylobacterium zucineum HLK1]